MKEAAKAGVRFLSIAFIFSLLFVPSQFASADDATTDYVKYVVKIENVYQTVIEGTIVDNELGTPVGGAGVGGEVRSDVIHVNVQADENGRFRAALPKNIADGNHTFVFNVSAPGYDNKLVTGAFKKGEAKNLRIALDYNPFDVTLA